mgnify:CR=1 FL=1|jgi:hypothetical protein
MSWTSLRGIQLSVTGTAADTPVRVRSIWAYSSAATGGQVTIADTASAVNPLKIMIPPAVGGWNILISDAGVNFPTKALVTLPANVQVTLFVDGV